MDVILQCLRHNCFLDNDNDDDSSHNGTQNNSNRHIQVLDRGGPFIRNSDYQPPNPSRSSENANDFDGVEIHLDISTDDNDNDNANANANAAGENCDDEAARSVNSNASSSSSSRPPRLPIGINNSIFNFLQNIGQHRHTIIPTEEQEDETNHKKKLFHLPHKASSFVTTTDDIPTIALSEVVLPGSQLQKKMSMALKNQGYAGESMEDECVICMEGFDATNPRMPTLCGCGENKTYFHLPCLYHWIEQSSDCPSCRKPLSWQEF